MPYQIQWSDESHTTVRQVYQDVVSRSDFEGMVSASSRMLQTVPHVVDIMIEWQGDRRVLNDLSVIYGAVFAEKRVPTNQRFVFAINAPMMFRVLAQALQRSAPRAAGSLYFVNTVEAAYSLRDILLEAEISSVS